MFGKKRLLTMVVAVVLVASAFGLSGCIEDDDDEVTSIVIAQRHEPEDFHPVRYSDVYTAYVFIQMYDTLISTYPNAQPNAEADGTIAEDFDISDDGLEMTFNIEEGLEFHNGDEVTAHDAEFTINTLMMDEDDDEYFDLYDVDVNPASPRSGDFANVDYVEAVDDYTLEIHMENRDMEMLVSGGFESLYILPSEYIQENGWDDYGNNLFGSGPYELEDRTPGIEVILTAFEDYRHDVNIDEVKFDFIDDETPAITSLRAGEVHYMSRIYPSNYHDLADEENVITRSFQDLGHNRIAFNQHPDHAEDFADPRVRKALAYAIDADEVIAMEMTEELASNTRSPVPAGHAAHNEDLMLYEQDIEEARSLLEEAGYEEDDDGMYFETNLYVPDDERANEMMVVVEHAEEAGIDINLEPLEWAEYISAVESGEAQLSYSGWSGTPSAQYIMAYMMEDSPWAYYSGWYEGTEFTEKIEQAVREPDDETRFSLYHEAQEILVEEDMGCYILYTERMPRAYHESLDIPEESWNPYMGAGPLVALPEWEVN